MNPLIENGRKEKEQMEQIIPTEVIKVATAQHPEAQWPLYYYELSKI